MNKTTLKTQHKNIRILKAKPSDAQEMVDLWAIGAKSGNWCWICSTKIPGDADVASLQQELAKTEPSQVRFIARDSETNMLIGTMVGSWRPESRMRHVVSCGWGVHPDFQGRGIGTALLDELLAYVQKQGFKRVEAEIAVENIASLRLAEKQGFVRECVKKSAFLTDDGRLVDMIVMAKLL